MGNYLNPYTQGQYVEDDITPIKGTLEWALQASNQEVPVVTNNTKQNTNDLRKSLSFDLEDIQNENDVLEEQFKVATAMKGSGTDKKSNWFSNIFSKMGKGFNTFMSNQGLQNAAFGFANSLIPSVEQSETVKKINLIGQQFSNKFLGGKAKFITDAALFGFNAIDSIGGKRTRDFGVNYNAINPVMGSYNNSANIFTQAVAKAGVKHGLFNSGQRKKDEDFINEADRQQRAIIDVSQKNEDLQAKVDASDYLNYQNEMNGGFDQRFLRAAKQGMKFKTLDRINNLNFNSKKLKNGGFIECKSWTPVIITNSVNYYQQGGTLNEKNSTRTIEELIAYAKEQNPRFIQRMSEPLRYVKVNSKDKEGKDIWNHSTHLMTNRGNKVFPLVQEDPKGQLFIIDDEDKAFNWATLNNNVLTFDTEEEALNFQNNYKQGWPDFFNASPLDTNPEAEYEEYEPHKYKLLDLYSSVREQFKEGGKLKEETEELKEETSQKNIIPEGALHKNKHHIENTDGLTQKGIPVIDNDGDQQAEIECDELILNLENTKFIEERYKKFYSNDLTQKEKDQLAVEVGELLVKEILYNTDDRTGLIDKVV